MTTRSTSKVKVALKICNVVLFCLSSLNINAQYSGDSKHKNIITLTCENLLFDNVLEELTRQAKVKFIYSSSKVSLDKTVTLNAEHLPLTHVLAIIGEQMSVSFKQQGDYYIIKKNLHTDPVALHVLPVSRKPIHESSVQEKPKPSIAEEKEDDILPRERYRVTVDPAFNLKDDLLAKDLLHFGPALAGWDTAVVLKFLPLLLDKGSLPYFRKKWFASAGFIINDYSVGAEVQAGIPALYAVVNGSRLWGGVYRLGYGLGTTIPVKPGLTANLSYTYGSIKRSQDNYRSVGQHHQMRLMANIVLSKHFSVRVGPSFNLLNTYHYFQETNARSVIIRYRSLPSSNISSSSLGFSQPVSSPTLLPATLEYKTKRSWAGFEAGVAYRINFSLRK